MTPGQIQQFILGEFGGGASLVTVRNQLAQQAGESLNWAAQKISDVLPNAFPNQGWDFSGLFTDTNITTGIPQGPHTQPAPPAATPAPAPAPAPAPQGPTDISAIPVLPMPQGPTDVSALPAVPMPPDWAAGGGQTLGGGFASQPEWSAGLSWQAIADEARRVLAAQRADDQLMQQVYNSSIANMPSLFGTMALNAPSPFGMAPSAPSPFGMAPSAPSPFGMAPSAPSPVGMAPRAPSPFGMAPSAPSPFR
jgi:pyruvate dehydrogenase E2 component (dihydrolipoamide acetyltransferase)